MPQTFRFLFCLALVLVAADPARSAGGAPKSFVLAYDRPLDGLNYYSQTGFIYTEFQSIVFDHLLEENRRTGKFEGSLAEKWEIGKDGKTFTFHLRKDAKFHDGKPVTAEDVKFTWESHKDPKYKSIQANSFHTDVKVEALDTHTVRFTAPYRSATLLRGIGSWPAILPKHFYGDSAKEGEWAKHALGSGPYKVAEFEMSKKIVLERNPDWWGFRLKENRDRFKFPRIVFRFVSDLIIATELLKKGEAHYVRYIEPTDFAVLAEGPGLGTEATAIKTALYRMKGSRGVSLNNRNPVFADPRVRLALMLLFNRGEVNEKLFYGSLLPGISYFHQENPAADPKMKPHPYDPKHAITLLREAGWEDGDKDGVLEREIDGKKTDLRFTLLNTKASREKLLTLFKEAAKNVGVDVEIRTMEAQSVFRLLNDQKFEAFYGPGAWSWGVVFPTDELHSRFASGPNPSNISGYANSEVDKILEQADAEFDTNKRNRILRKAYRILATDMPGLHWFDDAYLLYGVSKRVKRQQDALPYSVGWETWSW